jgi:hypothetical protein
MSVALILWLTVATTSAMIVQKIGWNQFVAFAGTPTLFLGGWDVLA